MEFICIGLGNPGEEYEHSRHNTGMIVLSEIARKRRFSDWKKDRGLRALASEGNIGEHDVLFVLPQTYMNRSGYTAKKLISSQKEAETLVVVHDEIDLPLGTFRISFGRGDAGHNGVRSITESLGTKDFIRIRVGVSPKIRGRDVPKKPKGEKKVLDFLLGDFRKAEETAVTLLANDIYAALETIFDEGYEQAMNEFNEKRSA